MDGEQESRWAAAQRIGVGEELVPAALRQLEFLAAVDRRRWLYEGPLLDRAIHRYKSCWLPLLAKHTQATVVDGPLVVPLDCEWIWHCHRLNPAQYVKDCKRLYCRILDNNNVESSIRTKSKDQTEKVWTELYPEEPFELEHTTPCADSVYVNAGAAGGISYDLVSAVKRQSSFFYQVGTPSMHDRRFLEEALARYKGFLYLIKLNQEKGMKLFRVPTYDVDLMWHTHQLHPVTYCTDMLNLLGEVLEHDDTDDDRAEGKKLDTGFSGTTEQFENTFGVRYWKAGAMYRGNMPSPVTSIPQIFSSEVDKVFGVSKADEHLTVLETTVLELYLQIVDIKNLPSAIPEESVYVWFTKTQPDLFISDGGRLDISTKTGKSIGAGFQCEPTGELILTVMIDQTSFGASSSKKSEPLGKVSISLQELIGPDSKLSLERWFELETHGGHTGSPPISLRVAASCTVPRRAPHVLSMISVEPFSLKACLLPPSIKDQKMSFWTRFVYDCGTELIRLQIREHKAKNGMALVRELVGVTKSPKKAFRLAEFKENKWSFNNFNLSITNDLKPSQDGCILELKGDNKLIKLYWGRRLAYERKCCSHHTEDAAAVTAVKFSDEHPYGKAVALLDTESEFIMVDEDCFLLPWITISFLFLNAIGKDGMKLIRGAMVQKGAMSESDTTMASETVVVGAVDTTAAPAQCGTCGTACGGDMIIASDKTGHASFDGTVTASGKGADSKCGGCGSGCGGGCGGSMVTVNSKVGHASCGTCGSVLVSGGNGHAESAGCRSGCGGGCGSMVIESSEGNIKSGGCGSGCGAGCGGGCGTIIIEGSKASIAKSSGCGSGCGGGCGGMMIEGSKTSHVKSGGCGSGCGGGCGGMVMEGSKTSHAKSGGCGSGCGSGCGGMVIEGSKTTHAKSGGCGSGCGGGCGGMVIEGSKTTRAKSGGCGSGCGGGCGGMVMEGSKTTHAKSGGCGSGCGGGCGGMVMEGSKTSRAKSGGCGSGCGAGCGGMVIEGSKTTRAKSSGCGSGCGGGCGGMVMEGSKTTRAMSGSCGSGCGSGCGGGCGTMFNANTKAGEANSGGCGSGCGGGCGGGANSTS